MSLNVEGILFRGEEADVVSFFCSLTPRIPLRLVRIVDGEVWGVCSGPTSGWRPELVEVAGAASMHFGTALYYGYFSVAAEYACQLFQSGELTHLQDSDPQKNNWSFKSNLEPLGLSADVDWDRSLESLFRDLGDHVILEH
ncbi:MAG: hypothetical protein AAF456_07665 [Planctomycetota bacterium]